jgi:hypothetical protein
MAKFAKSDSGGGECRLRPGLSNRPSDNLAGTSYGVTETFTRLVVQQHWKPPPPSPE